MIERRGDRKYNEPMPPDEAKARIIRFNEGGTLMDFSNHYLRHRRSADDSRRAHLYPAAQGFSVCRHETRQRRCTRERVALQPLSPGV